ncbi:MAG: hypothetical protein AAF614_16720 [Chloroflexota bacterium]
MNGRSYHLTLLFLLLLSLIAILSLAVVVFTPKLGETAVSTPAATAISVTTSVDMPSPTAISTSTPTPIPQPTTTPTTMPNTVTPTPTATVQPSLTPSVVPTEEATETPTATATSTTTTVSPYHLTLTPNNPQPYLDTFGLIAFYGSPTGPGLGILGDYPFVDMNQMLAQTVADYEPFLPTRTLLPTYHMIVTVATASPPYYHNQVDLGLIEEWVALAEERETAVILDIQPGHGNIVQQYNRIRHLLYRPHVHLAIDPEYAMHGNQVPLQSIGSLYAQPVNAIQADLNQIGHEIGLNRVLILHQFTNSMLPDKEAIVDYPHVEIVIDGDGVGSPAVKIRNYNQYAAEPAFEYGGFKLYPRHGDIPLLSPAEIFEALTPAPVLVIYQ